VPVTVYAVDPEDKATSIRFDIWAWHALWTYFEEMQPDFACVIPYNQIGEALDAEEAAILSERLYADIGTGAAEEYVIQRRTLLKAMPDITCHMCDGLGTRTDEVGHDLMMPEKDLEPEQAVKLGRARGWCNVCRGHGSLFAFDKAHDLTVTDIAQFADFCLTSGGIFLY